MTSSSRCGFVKALLGSQVSSSEHLSVFIAADMALRVNKLHLVKCLEMLATTIVRESVAR